LNGQGLFLRAAVQHFKRFFGPVDQPVGADHLRAHQRATGLFGQQAKGQVGDAGQRRQNGVVFQGKGSDLHDGYLSQLRTANKVEPHCGRRHYNHGGSRMKLWNGFLSYEKILDRINRIFRIFYLS